MAVNSRGLLGGAAALTVTALLAACGGGGGSPGPVAATLPKPSTSPPTYLTDAQYAAQLAAIDKPVSAALAKIAAGGGWSTLTATSTAASGAAEKLKELAVSDAQSDDNSTLSQDLLALSTDLNALNSGSDGEGDKACAAAVPGVQVGRTASVTALAADVGRLAASGRATGLTVPKFPKQQNRTLATGTYLRNTDCTGNGKLTIENGSSGSAVVTLKRNGARSFAVYLRKNGKFTVKGVRDGSYTVYFATGTDWDAKHRGFTTGCDYEKFDKSLSFTTKYTSSYVEYTTYTISLYGVVGGTASTTGVPPNQFPAP
ncbi:hypothetical protein [Streptacidiphilus cavernicola]|uniref:Lipoprotein n=1 Tax=Streptacidiphilus cavernicola TaxID=3342716 RepID=A0ABV6VQC9_9ACTN